MKTLCLALLLLSFPLKGLDFERLSQIALQANQNTPFDYALNASAYQGRSKDEEVLLVLHGYGASFRTGEELNRYRVLPQHILSFNFPDYGNAPDTKKPEETAFGTVNEILPVAYLLKVLLIDNGLEKVHLYGFSAGGGALINTIAALNGRTCDKALSRIGINAPEKQQLLAALQRSRIILDRPLKSIEEIIAFRGSSHELAVLAARYRQHAMRPIDALAGLQGLRLNIMIHFQQSDEVLSNRDDREFLKRLKTYNSPGSTCIISRKTGTHTDFSLALLRAYAAFIKGKCSRNEMISL